MARLNRRGLLAATCALAGAAALLAGCGGGGSDGGPAASADYLPLAVGNRWAADDGSESRITGQRNVGGTNWWVSSETEPGGPAGEESLLISDAQGVRVYQPADGTVPAFTSTLIRLPVVVGDRYPGYRLNYVTADLDGNGSAENVDARTDVEVVGAERVVTPAGTFDNALHLRMTYVVTIVYQPSGRREDLSTGTSDLWYAPDIGPVRASSTITTNGVAQVRNNLLAGYRVGNRSGGVLPGN